MLKYTVLGQLDYTKVEVITSDGTVNWDLEGLKIQDNFLSKDLLLAIDSNKDWVYRVKIPQTKNRIQFEVVWDDVKAYFLTEENFKVLKNFSNNGKAPMITNNEELEKNFKETPKYLNEFVNVSTGTYINSNSVWTAPNPESLILKEDPRVKVIN